MTQFIRPEAQAALWRWREVIVGAFLVILGVWWIVGPGGLMAAVGAIATCVGIGLCIIGTQRTRFRGARGGLGSVDVDEGQVIYFGPMTGGAVALRDMTELALLRTGVTAHWRLSAGKETVFIPINADGSDALFDAFSTLPGLKTERMLSILKQEQAHDTVIWSRSPVRAVDDRLH